MWEQSHSLPIPVHSQPLPWVPGASGASSLVRGFPSRSEGPSPLQLSRFPEITASLKIRYGLTSQALDRRGVGPIPTSLKDVNRPNPKHMQASR